MNKALLLYRAVTGPPCLLVSSWGWFGALDGARTLLDSWAGNNVMEVTGEYEDANRDPMMVDQYLVVMTK